MRSAGTSLGQATTGDWVGFPPTPHGIPVLYVGITGTLALLSLLVLHGFPLKPESIRVLNWVNVLLALIISADLALAPSKTRHWREALQSRCIDYLLLVFFVMLLVLEWTIPVSAQTRLSRFLHLESAASVSFNLVQLYLLLSLCIQALRAIQKLFSLGVRPELILAGSFGTLIVIGSLLLVLPNSSARLDDPISPLDAFFTSTSAVSVTGLVVRDTGDDFSKFGQMVILVLFQMGGLGIITFVAFLSIVSRRALPVRQMVAFQSIINAPRLSDIKRQIVGILLAAGVIELVGALLIYQFLPGTSDPLEQIRWTVFHTVSAFCNAGFALQSDSLERFHADAGLMFTFMGLIVSGGLGFLVIPELLGHRFTRAPLFRRFRFFRRIHAGQISERLSVHTRLALWMTLLLLVAGFVLFWVLERHHILLEYSRGGSFLITAFQSVTARTAGFNTIPIHELQPATLIFLMMLMVIGASPVSTGGGIKTVNFAILLLALRAMVMRRNRVEVFGRTLPPRTLFAALSVFVLYVIAAGLGIFLLALFDSHMNLRDQSFEVISALSTVGLSTGITADLSSAGKVVLCAAMFIGRVGPIALVLSVFQSRRAVDYEFPEEEVVVG